MIEYDDEVYVFKYDKMFKSKIKSMYSIDQESNNGPRVYIVDLIDSDKKIFDTVGLYRNDFFTKKDLRKLKIKRLI